MNNQIMSGYDPILMDMRRQFYANVRLAYLFQLTGSLGFTNTNTRACRILNKAM